MQKSLLSKTRLGIDMSQAQKERLAFLEMRVLFVGELRRPDIEARFGVKPAAASRDLTAYRKLAPSNLEYDPSARCYRPTPSFCPVFGFSTARVLSWLRQGFGDGLEPRPGLPAPCEGAESLCLPDLDILASVTRALCTGHALGITYLSLSSGPAARVIVPVALAENGLRWHVRAYDRQNRRFSDFVLRRIVKAEILKEQAGEGETLAADAQWARIVDLELVPHPAAPWPEGIRADYGMSEGVVYVRARAAMAGYVLQRWQVDCTPNHALEPAEHPLWLRNPQTLHGVDSAALAPGLGALRGVAVDVPL